MMKFILIFLHLFFSNDLILVNEYNINVTAKSRVNYILEGEDVNGEIYGDDPVITILEGSKVNFNINAPGHPFFIKTVPGTGKKNQVEGIENNGTTKGLIVWTPIEKGTYFYQCSKHRSMFGKIIVK